MLLNILRRDPAPDLLLAEKPKLPTTRADLAEAPRANDGLLEEYSRLTKSLGLANPHVDADLGIEKFKAFLRLKDWAVFSLPVVIEYMDKKSAEESEAKAGWRWRPLRAKDNIDGARFGHSARAWQGGATPASDYYLGAHTQQRQKWSSSGEYSEVVQEGIGPSASPYDKLVPIHALRKIAVIESEFGRQPANPPISFFVCDYAPAPHIEHPDPFLMAVVNNDRLSQGVGRFVIDFWDEPGFGLDKQLA